MMWDRGIAKNNMGRYRLHILCTRYTRTTYTLTYIHINILICSRFGILADLLRGYSFRIKICGVKLHNSAFVRKSAETPFTSIVTIA